MMMKHVLLNTVLLGSFVYVTLGSALGAGESTGAAAGGTPPATGAGTPVQPRPAKVVRTDPPVAPTLTAQKYGDHERQVLWFWQAKSDQPTPLLVIIHGGGWLHGDGFLAVCNESRWLLTLMLDNGISVAAVNYRYSTQAPLPAPVHDAARAIQYLRSRAAELNIDKTRVAATGGSAGGCTTLWLATHDDLADPKSADPVARESTRLCGAWANVPQTTIDPKVISEIGNAEALKHSMINKACGFKNNDDMDTNYARAEATYREFSPVNHLSKDDPQMLIEFYTGLDEPRDGIHHSKFGLLFKKKADEIGAPCYARFRKNPELYPGAPEAKEFLFQIFGMPVPAPVKPAGK